MIITASPIAPHSPLRSRPLTPVLTPMCSMPVTVATLPMARTPRRAPQQRSRSPSPLRDSQQHNLGGVREPVAPAKSPKPGAARRPGCRGFILASQYVSYAPDAPPPYADGPPAGDAAFELIPCPRAPVAPAHPSTECTPPPPGIERRDSACSNAGFCDKHWCGGCKRAERAWAALYQVKAAAS
ncbi:hypothetical protein Q8F55_003160 [Vanrija albida]|uniref:Uncharacterized protein n=1 Tax=Vanrija albida TaxID=181172 RepID=A0ABR3QBS7_9TREE